MLKKSTRLLIDLKLYNSKLELSYTFSGNKIPRFLHYFPNFLGKHINNQGILV